MPVVRRPCAVAPRRVSFANPGVGLEPLRGPDGRTPWPSGFEASARPARAAGRFRRGYAWPAGSPAPSTPRRALSVVSVGCPGARGGPDTAVRVDLGDGCRRSLRVRPAQRRPPPSRHASATCPAAPTPSAARSARRKACDGGPAPPPSRDGLSLTGRRPDAASTVAPAVRNLAVMVGDLLSATTRPAAARGAACPHAVSASPAAVPTRAGRVQARQRPAPVRPEIPLRSRPPPRRRVIPFACRPANPFAHACVWREGPSPRASRPVHRRRFERRPSPSHPDTQISWGAHRPTLVPGPLLLQTFTPVA